jgi:oligogalacturonide lyase
VSKGALYPAESRELRDPDTGARIRQVTSHPSIHHHPFFFVPPYDQAMRWLFFVSHRSGTPQLFAEERSSGKLLQLTDRPDFAEWSFHPSHDGRFVCFVAGTQAIRLNVETLREETLADFGSVRMREHGMVGAAMGTTTVSRDDRWWAIPVKVGSFSRFYLIDLSVQKVEAILERDTIGHPQFCPDNPDLIFYAGPHADRLWLVRRDGSGHRRLWQREHSGQWLTHESWIPGRRELAFVDWPNGMRAINVETGALRWVTRFPAWHAHPDASGCWFACDTNFPDRGLFRFPADGEGEPEKLCSPRASSVGAHWAGPFPYNEGPTKVYAPQHTHPHPRPAPDGSRVLYTSDVSGDAQLYEVFP